MHYYPHHIGDFRSGTINLTRQARWLYRDMLDVYYDTEKPLSLDIEKVCHDIGALTDEEMEVVKKLLRFKFIQTDEGYRHERCDAEIAAYHAKVDTAKENGKKGGRPRKPQNKTGSETEKNQSGFDPHPISKPIAGESEANHRTIEPLNQETPPYPPEGGGLFADEIVVEPSDPVAEVFDHWRSVMRTPRSALDRKRRTAIERALKSFTVAELCTAINGCAKTPHNMGMNDTQTVYNDIELICRNNANIERFMRNDAAPPRPVGPQGGMNKQEQLEARNRDVAQRWAEKMEGDHAVQ